MAGLIQRRSHIHIMADARTLIPESAMDRYDDFPNGHLLISPQALKDRLGEASLVLLDVRPTHELAEHGWIPGAVHLDLYGLGLTKTTPELLDAFIHMMRSQFALRGISLEHTVVAYEETSGIRAARAFWLLEYLGHEDVHVLDGGLAAWREAGLETSREMTAPRARSFKPNLRPELFMSADDLHARLGEPGLVILDTRNDDEYYGRSVRAARSGALPGAVHLEWTHYLDEKGRFKPQAELAMLFENAGITRDKPVVPY